MPLNVDTLFDRCLELSRMLGQAEADRSQALHDKEIAERERDRLVEEKVQLSGELATWKSKVTALQVKGPEVSVDDLPIWEIRLTNTGPNKINVIKEIRSITGLGLREAKDMAESSGNPTVRSDLLKNQAQGYLEQLQAVGASAYIIRSSLNAVP